MQTTLNSHFDPNDQDAAQEDTLQEDEALLKDDVIRDDSSVKSDTDTSRAEDSVTGDSKIQEPSKPIKKLAPKPVSFAKYSVPKVIAANSLSKTATENSKSSQRGTWSDTNKATSYRRKCFNGLSSSTRPFSPRCQIHNLASTKAESIPSCCTRSNAGLEQEQRFESLFYFRLQALMNI